jgi:5-methylcytosine-specific restriction endonuclease McrA
MQKSATQTFVNDYIYDTTRPLTEEKLIHNLKILKRRLGHAPSTGDMKTHGPHAPSTYYDYFDSWIEALKRAEITPENASRPAGRGSNTSYSKTDLVRALRSWKCQTGHVPTMREFNGSGRVSATPVKRTFDCWNDGLREAGLSPRCPEPQYRTGENNPAWKGGSDKYYGQSWEAAREKCVVRDNRECRRCGMSEEHHKQAHGCALHVHHIRPFRTFADHKEANKLSNLITLCRECHGSVEGLPIDLREE